MIGAFGGGHGLLDYYELTHDEGLKQALIKCADVWMAQRKMGAYSNMRKPVAFAARHADNPEPYREFLAEWTRTAPEEVQTVPHNPRHYSGPGAMLRIEVPVALFHITDEPDMMTAMDGDPKLNPPLEAEVRATDAYGAGPYTPPLLNWQSDLDRPELAEYLKIRYPQP